MSVRRAFPVWVVAFLFALCNQPSPGWAQLDPDDDTTTEVADSAFEVGSSQHATQPQETQHNAEGGDAPPSPAAILAATGVCLGRLESCLAEPAPPTISNDLLVSTIRRVRPPEMRLVVQPPGGKTLVNFDTIFSTEAEPFRRTVRLLGHEVVLNIWASSFSWQFGDGSEPLVTSEPGRTYERGLPMDSYITHEYEDADVTVHPRVNTTYSAEYSVDGGPFQPVIGTVTIDGEPVTLRVVEARPVLTGTR